MCDERARVLLKAAYDLIQVCNSGPYVKHAPHEIVVYDGAECDGICLANDIAALLQLDELDDGDIASCEPGIIPPEDMIGCPTIIE